MGETDLHVLLSLPKIIVEFGDFLILLAVLALIAGILSSFTFQSAKVAPRMEADVAEEASKKSGHLSSPSS
jgi:hypothetical protein